MSKYFPILYSPGKKGTHFVTHCTIYETIIKSNFDKKNIFLNGATSRKFVSQDLTRFKGARETRRNRRKVSMSANESGQTESGLTRAESNGLSRIIHYRNVHLCEPSLKHGHITSLRRWLYGFVSRKLQVSRLAPIHHVSRHAEITKDARSSFQVPFGRRRVSFQPEQFRIREINKIKKYDVGWFCGLRIYFFFFLLHFSPDCSEIIFNYLHWLFA